MKNVYIYVNACRKRSLDATRIRNYFIKNENKIVNDPKKADLIILLTCGFLNDVTEKSLEKVKHFQKYDAELIVAGCLPEIEKQRLKEIFDGNVISTKDIEKIDALFPEHKIKFNSIDDTNILHENIDVGSATGVIKHRIGANQLFKKPYSGIRNHILKHLSQQHSPLFKSLTTKKFHIRISSGCLGNCTYCAIKPAVGPFKSKPLNQIISEIQKGIQQGYTNFILESDDVGAYGLDGEITFPKLLDKITDAPAEYTISIHALSPRWLVKYLDDLYPIFKRKKISTLGIAMQSTSNRILKLMNRYSDMEKITNACIKLKNDFPDLAIDTHYILGFPSETEEEFKQTLNFVKQTDFNVGYFIPFSLKNGTKAEQIEPKITQKEISKRIRYAKKYLKNIGYHVLYYSEEECHFLLFDKSEKT